MKRTLFTAITACSLVATASPLSVDEFQNQNITEFGLRNTKQVVFTFDDGPGKGTEKILDTLKRYNVKATFFALARSVKFNPKLSQRIVDEGHILANHTVDHDRLSKDIYSEQPHLLLKDLLSTHNIISQYMPNEKFYYFRAPYGAWTNGHADNLNRNEIMRKYIGPVMWNSGSSISFGDNKQVRDAADWECWSTKKFPEFNDPRVCAEGYLASIERNQGGVVLFHDIHAKTAELIDYLVPRLIDRGYQFINLDQVEELKLYEVQQNKEFFQQRRDYYRNKK